MSDTETKASRPLSPHLQIYRPMLTMTMSIMHRITGAALYFGTVLLAWWLIAAAAGPDYFAFVDGLAGSILGRLVLFGYTWALMLHLIGGIRHFIWDFGRGLEHAGRELLAQISLYGSLGLTLAIWVIAYIVR